MAARVDEARSTFDRKCREIFVGPFEGYAATLTLDDVAYSESVSALADPVLFDGLLERFRDSYPKADRRAAISFWSQYYFGGLLAPAAILCVACPEALPPTFGPMRVAFCARRGTPLRGQLVQTAAQDEFSRVGTGADAANREREGASRARLTSLLDDHVAPMVAILRRHSGLSARLFWENAVWYLAWALGEAGRLRLADAPVAHALLREESWPRNACAAVNHLKRAALLDDKPVRRVCCLRHHIPGVARCAGACPLAEGSDAGEQVVEGQGEHDGHEEAGGRDDQQSEG